MKNIINANTKILNIPESAAIKRAAGCIRRDIEATCTPSDEDGLNIYLKKISGDDELQNECFRLELTSKDGNKVLLLSAGDELGFIYGLFYISREFLGVENFWFWNEQRFNKHSGYEVPEGFQYASGAFEVRFRGWFINDEVLIDSWDIDGDKEKPWEMAFEALLRCGGNMTIPGTDRNAHIYCKMASEMGLFITHHHAEPLGAQMFSRVYPELPASYDLHQDLFEDLWKKGIEAQKDYRVLWNLGFRGQGDRPFWLDDPAYDTPEARGKLISSIIRKQYLMVKESDADAICCSNLYGETMELYQEGLLDIPEDVILIWSDNGFGKMVSRRQWDHNPRVRALPATGAKGAHGIYYHASFYDLQAAGQMTMLPNSAEFVATQLKEIYALNVDDFWLINCSNIKPHVYMLDLISKMWQEGKKAGNDEEIRSFVSEHLEDYCGRYFGTAKDAAAKIISLWPKYCPKYGPNEDDHAGEQFPNHGARVIASAFITDFYRKSPENTPAADEWKWFSSKDTLLKQVYDYMEVISKAASGYCEYLGICNDLTEGLDRVNKDLIKNLLTWQVEYLYYSYIGSFHLLKSVIFALDRSVASEHFTREDPEDRFLDAFYEAGLSADAFLDGYHSMRSHEKGVFEGFYYNDCEGDIRESHYVARSLMAYLRIVGDGPYFYKWQRLFQKEAGGSKVHLILRVQRHLTDDDIYKLMLEELDS